MSENLKSLYKARRDLIACTASDGTEVIHVHLKGRQIAVVERADFDRLVRCGASPNWFLNFDGSGKFGYVRTRVPRRLGWGNVATVSRLIVMPNGGSVVRHKDGDRLNLRGDNLGRQKTATKASGWECSLPQRAAMLREVTSAATAL